MRIFQLALIVLSLFFVTNGRADEIADRENIADTVKSAFLDGNFKKLDALADEYRNSKARTGSGLWKLSRFYSAFDTLGDSPAYGERSLDRLEQQAKKWIDEAPESKSARPGNPYRSQGGTISAGGEPATCAERRKS